MFYAGAALPDALAARLREIARRVADHEVLLTSSWGTTETAPAATSAHFAAAATGCIGVPLSGVEVKLAPVAGKLEIRVRGPNVTPGLLPRARADAPGVRRGGLLPLGRRGELIDETDPSHGLRFDGRIAEDFKLLTGTWVPAGPASAGAAERAAGVLTDAVIYRPGQRIRRRTRLDQPGRGAPDLRGRGRGRSGRSAPARAPERALGELGAGAGSAGRIERLLLLSEPPSLDAGEITDKGYINQRACLERRAADVARLYAAEPDAEVIVAGARG